MYDACLMHVVSHEKHLSHYVCSLALLKALHFDDTLIELSSTNVLSDDVVSEIVLK